MNIIYVLYNPTNNKPVYVGKSSIGLDRPFEHIKGKSHSEKVNDWVKAIKEEGKEPILVLTETNVPDDLLDAKELFWINYFISKGNFLLNQAGVNRLYLETNELTEGIEDNNFNDVGIFIKNMRRNIGLTQLELSEKAGVGLRVIRELEQNHKTNFNSDSVNKILNLFNKKLGVVSIRM